MQNKTFKNRVFVKILPFFICFKILEKKEKEKRINLAVVEKKKFN